jgi:hypothetical protein
MMLVVTWTGIWRISIHFCQRVVLVPEVVCGLLAGAACAAGVSPVGGLAENGSKSLCKMIQHES